jgi:pentatricopeptide repeat protein
MRAANIEPNEVTFATVIGACAKACANLQANAATTATTMPIETATATITPAAKARAVKQPQEFQAANSDDTMPTPLRKALQILNVMRKDPTVVKPNIQVYNVAIRACAEGLDVTKAFQLLQMLEEDGLEANIVTYGTLMMACQRVGSISGMNRVFALLRESGLSPNEIIYGAALSCCRKAGQAEQASLLLQKMIREGLQPNIATFNTVLLAQAEGKNISAKDLDRAVRVVRLLTDRNQPVLATPNRQTFSILIRLFATHKRPRDAEAALRLMRQQGIVADVDLYTATISSYERIGQPLNALRLMESMRADGYDFYEVEVLNTLFKRLVKLANAVGQTLSKSNDRESTSAVIQSTSLWNETSIA